MTLAQERACHPDVQTSAVDDSFIHTKNNSSRMKDFESSAVCPNRNNHSMKTHHLNSFAPLADFMKIERLVVIATLLGMISATGPSTALAQSTFTKITTGPVVTDGGNSRGGNWGDYDNDGYLDLFVANDNGQNDFLYHNNRDGSFTRISSGPVVTSGGNSAG